MAELVTLLIWQAQNYSDWFLLLFPCMHVPCNDLLFIILSSFKPTTPPHKMFRDKPGIFPRVHWKLVRVFVCAEDQAFFKSDCNLTEA